MKNEIKTSKTRWHRLLGALLEEILVPVGISVFTDFPIMSEPPESDILLLRKEGHIWSDRQKAFLPDGIRDSRASHILIEFKYTESVNENAVRQIMAYDYFYRSTQGLKKEEAESFLISAKTPQKNTLNQFGYAETDKPGVYKSSNTLLRAIPLISLNELTVEEYNVWFKCFASRKEEKKSAFALVIQRGLSLLTTKLEWMTDGLTLLFEKGERAMTVEITPETVMELGKNLRTTLLSHLRPEEIDKILSTLKPEKRLEGLKPEEIESYLVKIKSGKKKDKR